MHFSSVKLAERCIIVNLKMRTKENIDGNKRGVKIATMKSSSSDSTSCFLTLEVFVLLFTVPFCFSFPYRMQRY
jgi:hypothetical protein